MKRAKPTKSVKVVTRKPRATWADVDALVAFLNAAIRKVEEQEARFYLQEAEMRERIGRMELEYKGSTRYGCCDCHRQSVSVSQRLRWLLTGKLDKSDE